MNLEKLAEKQVKNGLQQSIKNMKEALSGEYAKANYFTSMLSRKQFEAWQANEITKKEVIEILTGKLEKDAEKSLKQALTKINAIKKAEKFINCGADIEWVNNRTWGYCPKGSYRNCYSYIEYKSITGCGYDKLSTLTARMFNDDLHLLNAVAEYIEKHNINDKNIDAKLGYGIRINKGVPTFSGAVGVDCHLTILRKIGFTVNHVSGTTYDNIQVDRKHK